MKNGIITTIDWSLIGATLAQESDEEQTEFFKSFIKEAQTYGTNHQMNLQMASINLKLTEDEKEILKGITCND